MPITGASNELVQTVPNAMLGVVLLFVTSVPKLVFCGKPDQKILQILLHLSAKREHSVPCLLKTAGSVRFAEAGRNPNLQVEVQ